MFQVFLILTRLKLKRGEGNIVFASPQVRSRKRRAHFPQYPPPISPQVAPEASPVMAHEGEPDNMSEDEKAFRKELFDMTKMVKVLYEEINTRFQGESSNPPKGDKPPRGDGGNGEKPPKWNGGNGEKTPLTPLLSSPPSPPPSSPSSSSTSTPSQAPPHSPKEHGETPLLKLYINFEFPMYNGEVNAKILDN